MQARPVEVIVMLANMMRNEGNIDRALRIIFGFAILALYFVGPRTPWGLVGIVLIITGLHGWCPVYQMFGVSTCRTKSA